MDHGDQPFPWLTILIAVCVAAPIAGSVFGLILGGLCQCSAL